MPYYAMQDKLYPTIYWVGEATDEKDVMYRFHRQHGLQLTDDQLIRLIDMYDITKLTFEDYTNLLRVGAYTEEGARILDNLKRGQYHDR